MQGDREKQPLKARAEKLLSLSNYQNPDISVEGYGTLIQGPSRAEQYFLTAESAQKALRDNDSEEAIPKYIQALYLYIRAQSASTSTNVDFLLRLKKLCKYIDEILVLARKYGLSNLKNVLKWTVFNLKLQYLFMEVNYFEKKDCPKTQEYLARELNILGMIFCSRPPGVFTLLPIHELEAEIRQRLAGGFK